MEENKIYEKNFDLNNIKLPTNEPKKYDEYIPYAKVLKKQVDNDNIKNIGIVGPYGAGKSSLLKTYIEMEKEINHSFENNIIKISLANYDSIINDVASGDKCTKEKNVEQNIEKSILQQLFYKNDNINTPNSRFQTLKSNKNQHIKFSICLVLLILCILFFSICLSIKESIKYLFLIIVIGFSIFPMFYLIYNIIKMKTLKSIKFGEINFEKNTSDQISIFNQYLDEIIYFFRENKFKILIIEDLDRFDNLAIFSKLQELNTLLNNNDLIKKNHKKITFIYVIRDSMFKNVEERSKFFDFVITIMPSITSNNIKDELEKSFKSTIKFNPLSSKLLIEISNYILNRRILNNIISDFIIHRSILKFDTWTQDNYDKLFALMTLKNLFPVEYENLQKQSEESIIYKTLIANRATSIKKISEVYIKEKEKNNELLNKINNEKLKSVEELRALFYGYVCKMYPKCYKITYTLNTFIDADIIEFNYYSNNSYNFNQGSFSIHNIESHFNFQINEFSDREQILNKEEYNKKEEVIFNLSQINAKLNRLNNSSFKELLKANDTIIDETSFKNCEYIKYAIINGYIDETYPNYLSNFSNDFMSKKDKKIIAKIILKEKIDTFSEIDSANKIILALDKEKFSLDSILNYYLLNELLTRTNNDYIEKKKKLIESIKNKSLNVKEFIEEILKSNENCFKLLLVFCKECSFIFDDICNNSKILYDEKENFLFYLLNELNLKDLKTINDENNLTKLINISHNFCINLMTKKYSINELFEITKFSLQHIGDDGNKSKLFEAILNNNYYELNLENIQTILINYYQYSKVDVFLKNYDLIKILDDCALKNRIETNLSQYLNLIYDDNSGKFICGQLSSDNFLNLLLNKEIDDQLKFKIIKKENNKVTYSSDLTIEIVENLMIENKIILSTNDLTILIDKINKEILINYIEKNNNQLEINDYFLENNENFKTYFFNNINISLFKDRIKNKYNNISNIQNDNNINYLLNNDLVLYEGDDFKSLIEQKRYIRNYCTKFEKEITNDIESDKLILNDSLMANLYFAICTNKSELLKVILKKMSIETGKMILDSESKDIFIQEVNSYDVNENIKSLVNNFIEEKDTIKY